MDTIKRKIQEVITKMDLLEIVNKYNIKINAEQEKKLNEFIKMMLETNKHTNLTRIVERDDINVKHLLDSLMLLTTNLIKDGEKLLDIGAGAGFPSTPLAICSDIKVVQIEASLKKVEFLTKVANELNLNITPLHARAEELGKTAEFREKYDVVTARAVTTLDILSELCLPFVKTNGHFIALKGDDVEQELSNAENAIKTIGGEIYKIKKYTLENQYKRALIIIKKISKTPNKYPRSYAKMKKTTPI